MEDLRNWLRGIGFGQYAECLSDGDFNAADVRSFGAKTVMQVLTLPNMGVALEFDWALRMGDVRSEDSQRLDLGRTALSRLTEIEVAALFSGLQRPHVGALFLHHHVTGKGIEILDLTDLQEMGFANVNDIWAVLEVRMPAARSNMYPCTGRLGFDGGCSDPSPSISRCAPAPASTLDNPVASNSLQLTGDDAEAGEHACLMRMIKRAGRSGVWSCAAVDAVPPSVTDESDLDSSAILGNDDTVEGTACPQSGRCCSQRGRVP